MVAVDVAVQAETAEAAVAKDVTNYNLRRQALWQK